MKLCLASASLLALSLPGVSHGAAAAAAAAAAASQQLRGGGGYDEARTDAPGDVGVGLRRGGRDEEGQERRRPSSSSSSRDVRRRAQAPPPYSARDVYARFLEQATFGPTASGIDELESAYGGDFAAWVSDQMDAPAAAAGGVPVTSHREFYRRYANARFEYPFEGGTVTHPCQRGTKYRLYAFVDMDNGKKLQLSTVGTGPLNKVVSVDGKVRTQAGDVKVDLGNVWTGPNLADLGDDLNFYRYTLCDMGNTEPYLDIDGGESSYVGVRCTLDGPPWVCYGWPDAACRALHVDGGRGNSKVVFDWSAASPTRYFDLGAPATAQYVQPHMNANYGGSGRTPEVQELVLTEDIYDLQPVCGTIGPTGNPDDEVVVVSYDGRFWLHDPRFSLSENTVDAPLVDGGEAQMAATRDIFEFVDYDSCANGVLPTDDVNPVRCANVPRTFVNEEGCALSPPSVDTCLSRVVCGSPNEVANDLVSVGGDAGPSGGAFYVNTEKHAEPLGTYRTSARKQVWTMIALNADDQLRQRVAWALAQILVISPVSLEHAGLQSEAYVTYYDIFVRNAFGNYRDVLKEVSYSPMMGEMLSYSGGTSTAYAYIEEGLVQYPDENYAREIMQLFTIGLSMLNQDGTEIVDGEGKPLLSYTNEHIEEYARVWTGFAAQTVRGNMERHYCWNRIDPMKIVPEKRDMFPKLGLQDRYIGDGYPLCVDLPSRHFLKSGAKYYLVRDSGGTPEYQVDSDLWAKTLSGSPDRLEADPNGELYAELCQSSGGGGGGGACRYPSVVKLSSDLTCSGEECHVDAIRTIRLAPGIYYEYVRPPCVEHAFYSDGKKVVPYDYAVGPDGTTSTSGSGYVMCANPGLEAANSACCTPTPCPTCPPADGSFNAYATDQKFWGERVKYSTAEGRCSGTDGTCDLPHMGAFCFPTYNQFQYIQGFITEGCTPIVNGWTAERDRQTHFWTSDPCQIKAKIDPQDGKVGIVHSTTQDDSLIAAHVQEGTKTLFRVDWGGSSSTSLADVNAAVDASASCTDSADGAKVCDVTVVESAVFSDVSPPSSAEDVLAQCHVGAFHPSFAGSSVVTTTMANGVAVHHIDGTYSIDSVFEVIDANGVTHLRKNVKSVVTIDGTSLEFRNPVHMMSLVDPEPRDAHHETDAAIDQYFYHPNTAPFLAVRFAQRFGISNPSPDYVGAIASAFRTGTYTPAGSAATFGEGRYGDMSATIAAVLLHPDARDVALDALPSHGSLGEPLLRIIKLMRALDFSPASHHRITGFMPIGGTQSLIGQGPHEMPSVFSFFLPEFSPAGTRVGDADLKSPESQLATSPNVMNLVNIMYSMIRFGLDQCYYGLGYWGFSPGGGCWGMERNHGNFTYAPAIGMTSEQVVDELATLMTAGRLSEDNRAIAKSVYESAAAGGSAVDGLVMAQQLIASAPEFHTLGSSNVKSGQPRALPSSSGGSGGGGGSGSGTPYKAVVYLMLAGGYDSWNVLVPHACHDPNPKGEQVHHQYTSERGVLALTQAERTGTLIDVDPAKETSKYGAEGAEPCSQYATHPDMPLLKELYDGGDLAFFANVGVINQPVNKDNYNELTKTKLFAHNTMQDEAKRVDPYEDAPDTGILGRALDVLADKDVPGTSTKYVVNSLSIDVPTVALRGVPFASPNTKVVSRNGPAPYNPAVGNGGADPWDIRAAMEAANNATSPSSSSMYGEIWSSSLLSAIQESEELQTYLDDVSLTTGDEGFANLGKDNSWWENMILMLLKLIHTREDRGVDRDVFFVEMPGWDHHKDTKEELSLSLKKLNSVLDKYVKELNATNLWDHVTLVSTSDFGRTLVPNTGGGCDHAWGGHYWAMGGSVDGGQIHGRYPKDITSDGNLNIGRGRGRMIPELSWESVWTGVLEWMGLEGDNELDAAMPNRHNTGTRLFTKDDIFVGGLTMPPSPPTTSDPTSEPTETPTFAPTSSPATDVPTASPVDAPPPTAFPTSSPMAAAPAPVVVTNLALHKSTTQRITPMGTFGTSDLAVDGNTDGDFWGGLSVTHGGGNDWWQVDLGDMHSIHSVKVYNRQDCCKERLNVISFVIFDDAFGIVLVHTAVSNSPDIVEWTLPSPTMGRHVQIQNAQILHVAEVEVYGVETPPPPTPQQLGLSNLALGMPTSQRITPMVTLGTSDLAVDGNTDGMWAGGSVTHGGGNDWWQVDLGSLRAIHIVKVYNRLDCCKERMNVLSFVIFDENFTIVTVHTAVSSSPDVVEWRLDVPVSGRHVQVQNQDILHMAEVEVYGV